MEVVTCWTRQVSQMWEELRREGTFHVKEEYIRMKNDTIADYYLDLYQWYTKGSARYVDIPEEAKYPVWFSLSEEFRLQHVPDTVLLTLEIPRESLMIIDMDKWDYRANQMYVPIDREDRKRFEKELVRYGIADETALAYGSAGNFYPMLKKEVVDSWNRIFTMPPKDLKQGFATAWELKKEWVKEVSQDGTGR